MDQRIYENAQWLADLDETIDALPVLNELAGHSVLITGATGLIGSAVTDLLLRFNRRGGTPVRIYAAGRSAARAEARFGSRFRQSDFIFVPFDAALTDNRPFPPCDYMIHGAGNATPAGMMAEPVETMLSNIIGLSGLLAQARQTRRTLFISSSEIYGRRDHPGPARENDCGYIDPLQPRSAYPMAKRAAETLCAAYAQEYSARCVIARPGHIYGPTASANDSRVSSLWAHAAAKGEDIIMKSEGNQRRSYCYCLDCASALLTILLKGDSGSAYNISHPDSVITIKEMANLLARAGGVQVLSQPPTRQERQAFNPMTDSSLDSTRLASLGWRGMFDADRGFAHTVAILRELHRGNLSSGN